MMALFAAVAKFMSGDAVKGVLLSATFAILGFVCKQAVSEFRVDSTLEWHGKAITELQSGQQATHQKLEDLAVTSARIDGKLDVLSQKIDDDRWERQNYQQRHLHADSK